MPPPIAGCTIGRSVAILMAVGVVGCGTTPTFTTTSTDISFSSMSEEHAGLVSMRTVAWHPEHTEPIVLSSDTVEFTTYTGNVGLKGVVARNEAHQQYNFVLALHDSLPHRIGEWTEDIEPIDGREGMQVRKYGSLGAPPSMLEYVFRGQVVARVQTEWEHYGSAWVAVRSSTTLLQNGKPTTQTTREVLTAIPTGRLATNTVSIPRAQYVECCSSEYGDFQDALFAYNVAYGTWVASCALTGLPGCGIAAIGLGGAAWFLDNKQESLNACWYANMADASCSLAGFLRSKDGMVSGGILP